jgi:hypothetical protein
VLPSAACDGGRGGVIVGGVELAEIGADRVSTGAGFFGFEHATSAQAKTTMTTSFRMTLQRGDIQRRERIERHTFSVTAMRAGLSAS